MNFKQVLLGLLFYFILIDSGGPIGVRNISLVYFTFSALYNIYYKNYSFKNILLSLMLLFVIVGIVFVSTLNTIDIFLNFGNYLYLLLTVVFSFSFMKCTENDLLSSLLIAGNLFIITIYVSFFSFIIDIPVLSKFMRNFLKDFPGWFYLRDFLGIPFVQIYFQATLSLVPIGLIALHRGHKKLYILYVLSLFVCFSRFGVFTLVAFGIILNFFPVRKICEYICTYFVLFSLILISLYSIYYLTINNYINDGSSSGERIGHIKSIFDILSVKDVLIGQGDGSLFYSDGAEAYIDNTELTQLSFFRKNGILIYIIFHLYINIVIIFLNNNKKEVITLVLCSFLFVSLSNPVLTSLTFALLFGMSTRFMYSQ